MKLYNCVTIMINEKNLIKESFFKDVQTGGQTLEPKYYRSIFTLRLRKPKKYPINI